MPGFWPEGKDFLGKNNERSPFMDEADNGNAECRMRNGDWKRKLHTPKLYEPTLFAHNALAPGPQASFPFRKRVAKMEGGKEVGMIDFSPCIWYKIFKRPPFPFPSMKKGIRFLNQKLAKRITHRPKPWVGKPRKKALKASNR